MDKLRDKFLKYRRKMSVSEMRPYDLGENLNGISVSDVDWAAGSPKEGDMIARNPENHKDKWLVASDYFDANFEPAYEED